MTGLKQLKTNGVVRERDVKTPDEDISEEEFYNDHVVHTNNNT